MIRITRQSDSGLMLLGVLARDDGRDSWPASDLAAETHLPLAMVSKILKGLARAGIIASQRGARGGYRLDRDPAEVSVDEILTALEGPIALVECTDPAGDCEKQCFCDLHPSWERINRAIRDTLRGITLADMVGPMTELPRRAASALEKLN